MDSDSSNRTSQLGYQTSVTGQHNMDQTAVTGQHNMDQTAVTGQLNMDQTMFT